MALGSLCGLSLVLWPLASQATLGELYASAPDATRCDAGRLHEEQARQVLGVVNEIRRLHGLGEVTWDERREQATMQAALMLAVNRRLSHHPSPHWRCHSPGGAQAASWSNLHLSVAYGEIEPEASADMVVGFITETRNLRPGGLGHRRWLLDPFLKRVAFGRVGLMLEGTQVDAAVLSVVPPASDELLGMARWGQLDRDHLAWPEGDYPQKYFDPDAFLSFSAVVDLSDRAANLAVDYRQAQVTLRRADGRELSVTQLSYDHQMMGLPNNLQFKAIGIEPEVEHEAVIRGVRVDGVLRDFRYRFRILP